MLGLIQLFEIIKFITLKVETMTIKSNKDGIAMQLSGWSA